MPEDIECLEPLSSEEIKCMEEFMKVMREEVIPKIVKRYYRNLELVSEIRRKGISLI